MANDISKQLSKTIDKINKALKEVQTGAFLSSVGNMVVPMIQGRVRRGYSVDKSEGQESKFAPLSKSYIEQRKGKAIYFKQTTSQKLSRVPNNSTTSKYFKFKQQFSSDVASATRSNLNQFGKMINDLGFRLLSKAIEVRPTTKYARELTAIHEVGNSKLPARPYLHLSVKEIIKVRQLFEKKLGSAIRSLIK